MDNFEAVFIIDSIRTMRLELVELSVENRQQMLCILLDVLADSTIPYDAQIVLQQYFKEYHDVKKTIDSTLTNLDALEHELD